MHIGELSRHTGVSVRSIRHYDDNGLLGARRGENGYRIFDEAAVRRVLRIKQLIHHGLTVEEIRPMAACLDGPADEETVCDHVIALYEQKLRSIDDEIAALRAQRERVAERLRALNLRRAIDARLGGLQPTLQPASQPTSQPPSQPPSQPASQRGSQPASHRGARLTSQSIS